jgi:hypothetical protein
MSIAFVICASALSAGFYYSMRLNMKQEPTVSKTEEIGKDRIIESQRNVTHQTPPELSALAKRINDCKEIKKDYRFIKVGYYPNDLKDLQSAADLKSGFHVMCHPEHNNPEEKFTEDLYITGINDHSDCACAIVKEKINSSIKSTEMCLNAAYNEPLSENFENFDRDCNIRYYSDHLKEETKPRHTSAVYRALRWSEGVYSPTRMDDREKKKSN